MDAGRAQITNMKSCIRNFNNRLASVEMKVWIITTTLDSQTTQVLTKIKRKMDFIGGKDTSSS